MINTPALAERLREEGTDFYRLRDFVYEDVKQHARIVPNRNRVGKDRGLQRFLYKLRDVLPIIDRAIDRAIVEIPLQDELERDTTLYIDSHMRRLLEMLGRRLSCDLEKWGYSGDVDYDESSSITSGLTGRICFWIANVTYSLLWQLAKADC